MPHQYYTTGCFKVSLATYLLVLLAQIIFWYNTVALVGAGTWIPLAGYTALGLILVLFPSSDKNLRLPSALVPLIILLSLVLVQFMLDILPHALTPTTLAPPLMVICLICVILVQRHHPFAPWILLGTTLLLVIKWHSEIFLSRPAIAAEFLVPIMVLYASHLFKRHMEQASRRAVQAKALRHKAELRQVAETDISNISAQRVEEVRQLTEDMLHRIAYNPQPVTEREMQEFRYTEAQLRDTIRGRHIVNPEILAAALIARRRGVRVDILDERGQALPPRLARILTVCALDLLDNARTGTITIRALPVDDPTALMLVHDGNSEDDEPSAIEISPDGTVDRF